MIRAERISDALRLIGEMNVQGLHPYPRVLIDLISKLALAGEVNSLRNLEQQLPYVIN